MENIDNFVKVDNKKKYYYKKYERLECVDCGGSYMRTNKMSHYKSKTHTMKSNIIKLTNTLNNIHKQLKI